MPDCSICFDELDESNACQFLFKDTWSDSTFCIECISHLRSVKYEMYMEQFAKSNCAKEQREMIKRGVPKRLFDPLGFPGTEGAEIKGLRLRKTKKLLEHHLENAPRGEARLEKMIWMRSFYIPKEKNTDGADRPKESNKGNNMDNKGNNTDNKGNNTDNKGNNTDNKGNNMDTDVYEEAYAPFEQDQMSSSSFNG